MAISRGVQNKVLEGVAAGLPFVVTRAVAGGLPSAVLPAVTIADDPDSFADALVRLLRRPPAERQDVMRSLRLESIDWSATLAPLEGILRSVAESGLIGRDRVLLLSEQLGLCDLEDHQGHDEVGVIAAPRLVL